MPSKSNADSKTIWMDGKLVPYEDARVHVLSHSLHYGGAAFEGMRAYEGADGQTYLFRAVEHFQRFLDSIRALYYETDLTITELIDASKECIRGNGFKECYVRPIAYLDDSVRGLKLPDHPLTTIAIAAWKWGKYMGAEGQQNGVRVAVSTYRRPDVSSSMALAKISANYMTSVLARREATKNGYDEAILLDPVGFVAEGSGENLFMVKNKTLYTPPTTSILPGITRDTTIRLAKDMGYTVSEENLTRNHLYLADEVFFTGTAVEITPIREIDNHTIGSGKPGPVTKTLSDTFFKCVRGELRQYREWLTQI